MADEFLGIRDAKHRQGLFAAIDNGFTFDKEYCIVHRIENRIDEF